MFPCVCENRGAVQTVKNKDIKHFKYSVMQ